MSPHVRVASTVAIQALLLSFAPAIGGAAVDGMSVPVANGSSCGIYVATNGADDALCGQSPGDPCRTIQQGIDRASADGQTCVFVQAGQYTEVLRLREGIAVIGGFADTWLPGPFSDPAHETRVTGLLDPTEDQFYVPGNTRRLFEINGTRFGVAICH